MKEYNYSDIVKVDKRGILFSDAEFMEFEDCRREWAKENNISVTQRRSNVPVTNSRSPGCCQK